VGGEKPLTFFNFLSVIRAKKQFNAAIYLDSALYRL
jgi:hypothetical protein